VLDDVAVTPEDLGDGLYDGASVELWRVDWEDPALRVRLWKGTIARVQSAGARFTAEVEGPLAKLDRVVGRTYGRTCDAVLGDARCRADLSGAAWNGAGVVTDFPSGPLGHLPSRAGEGRQHLLVSGLEAFAAGWFAGGRLTWTSGANAGRSQGVAAHRAGLLVLDDAPRRAVAAGDGFTMRAGCDKRWATCRAKFGNGANFQGFPQIPGDDFLTAYPVEGGRHDGGRRG
jgi:uncharacterized phage protein (TIGR02218 family)